MLLRILNVSLLVTLIALTPVMASEDDTTSTISDTAIFESDFFTYLKFMDSVNNAINYRTGKVVIGNDLATLNVPEGYNYINPDQADYILTELWGNPPGQNSLGMILPANTDPFTDSSYAIIISFIADGYVDDDDAKDLDYGDLLETIKEDTREWNTERTQMGYEPIEVIGWASAPYYDAENKKLHWAKELQFGDEAERTLNYDIRILGRKGYLEMNFIGGMYVLPKVKQDMEGILSSIDFNKGHRYSDFNPDMDEVAAYGIGGLIAGKVLAKAGFFALLLKFWKFIAIGVVGAFAAIKKFLGFKKKNEEPQAPANPA